MAWVEGIKRTLTQDEDNVAHGIQMEGMQEHESAFATHRGATDVEIAKKYSMAQRCVAIGKDGKLDAIKSNGEAIKVDTYPFRTGKINELDTYHCGLAVQLYFYFHIDAFFLFLVLFLFSLYAWVENHSRNALRNDCRGYVDTWAQDRLTGKGDSAGHDTLSSWLQHIDGEDKCGFSALDYALPEQEKTLEQVRRRPTSPGATPPHPMRTGSISPPPTHPPTSTHPQPIHPPPHLAPYLTSRHPLDRYRGSCCLGPAHATSSRATCALMTGYQWLRALSGLGTSASTST